MKNVHALLVGILTIAFVVLKLVGVIHWSWWWVLSPPVISAAIAVITYWLGYFTAYLIILYQNRKNESE